MPEWKRRPASEIIYSDEDDDDIYYCVHPKSGTRYTRREYYGFIAMLEAEKKAREREGVEYPKYSAYFDSLYGDGPNPQVLEADTLEEAKDLALQKYAYAQKGSKIILLHYGYVRAEYRVPGRKGTGRWGWSHYDTEPF